MEYSERPSGEEQGGAGEPAGQPPAPAAPGMYYHTLFRMLEQAFCLIEKIATAPGQPSDYRYLAVNPAFTRHSGLPDATGRTLREVMPEIEPHLLALCDAVLADGQPRHFEEYVAALEAWMAAEVLPGPQPGQLVVLFSNVTARHQAEAQLQSFAAQLAQQVAERTQALQESRDLLHAVAESQTVRLSAFTAVRDAHGQLLDLRCIFTNSRAGQQGERLPVVGQPYLQQLPTAERARLVAAFSQIIDTGVTQEQEVAYPPAHPTAWLRTISTKLGDGVLVSEEDITLRMHAEQEQVKNLRLLEQADAVASMGSWDYERATGVLTWSSGMYRLFGVATTHPVALDCYRAAAVPDDQPLAERLEQQLVAGTGTFEETLRLHIGEQVKTVRVKGVVLPSEQGQPARVLGVDLDISDVQRLEAENLTLRLDQQKSLLLAILHAQETERNRLAESLHNGLGQLLYATKLQVSQLDVPELHLLPDLDKIRSHVDSLLSEAIRQTRTLSHELLPATLTEQGLGSALRDICRGLTTPQLRFVCHVWLDEQELSSPLQTTLYRLAQELAHNIAKHSGASQATLEFELLPGWVSLRAEDNGQGFDPATTPQGLGLRLLHETVELLRGSILLDSSPEFGTHIRLRIPLT